MARLTLDHLAKRYGRGGDPAAEPYKGEFVSGNYFTMFGIRAFTGRLLAPPDDSSAAPRVAVMNYHTWQQHFGLDALVIGSTVNINGVPYTIAGVAPPRFLSDGETRCAWAWAWCRAGKWP